MDVREIAKSRSQRIQADYFRRTTWLTRSRALMAGIALVIACLYAFWAIRTGGSQFSTGRVAAAHASFENDCHHCHADFTPISGDALQFASAASLNHIDEACQSCHQVAHHFRGQMKPAFAAMDQHCSGCHTDHQGREHDMLRISETKCTQCHANLAATCNAASTIEVRADITRFGASEHGDFRSLSLGDPGRVKFDHAQHMRAGQVKPGNRGAFTIAMLESDHRERYRKTLDGIAQDDDSLVTLACADCHTLAGVPGTAVSSDAEIGRHIEPIAFDRHCAACHALNSIGRTEQTLAIPHAAPWREVETLLSAKKVGGQETGAIRMPRDATAKIPPLGSLGEGRKPSTQSDLLPAIVANLRAELEQKCLQCHQSSDLTDEAIGRYRRGEAGPMIPPRWLRRGIYDHAAHRLMDCAFCHGAAYPVDSGRSSLDDEPESARPSDHELVMIGGIETCTGCHRPAESAPPDTLLTAESKRMLGGQTTWASDRCTTCHRYHWERGKVDQSVQADKPLATMRLR